MLVYVLFYRGQLINQSIRPTSTFGVAAHLDAGPTATDPPGPHSSSSSSTTSTAESSTS